VAVAPAQAPAGSDGQAMTALGTAAGQNLTAILGGHAGTETMDTFALQNAGLKSTFHDKANAERSKTQDSIGIAP